MHQMGKRHMTIWVGSLIFVPFGSEQLVVDHSRPTLIPDVYVSASRMPFHSIIIVCRGINFAVESVVSDLKKRATMISTTAEIAQVRETL